jgi:hypothetical protein
MLHPVSIIERFYAAFGECDGAAMSACYAPAAHFSDPVFPDLNGDEPGAMWRMLTSQATDLRIELLEHTADAAHWRAFYTFSQTGRPVENDVRARFRLDREGLIADHKDEFGFHRWARQALGPPGLLLGWTPLLRSKVRSNAAKSLASFMRRDAGPA